MSKFFQSRYSVLDDEESDGSLGGLVKPESPIVYCPDHGSKLAVLWKYFSYAIVGCLSAVLSFVILLRIQPQEGEKMEQMTPRTETIWHRQREWQSGPAAEKLWQNLVPGGTGVVLIKDPHKYSLHPGLETAVENAGVYTLSGAHQSHCIKLIREALMTFISAEADVSTEPAIKINELNQSAALDHAFHCVDYLRQTIMCNADTTIEWEAQGGDRGGHSGHINGYGIPHQCRNWNDLKLWMEERYPPDEKYQTRKL
ncbi:MAG: hypothetical protein Q9170_005110 [Blastenia crenularia]